MRGVRLAVLAEYEAVFERLGWDVGLVLPRHIGEAWWLMRSGNAGKPDASQDALLVSSHEEGFTAVISRAGEPVLVRGVACDAEDRLDELYRLLLFYRERLAVGDAGAHANPAGDSSDDIDGDDATTSDALAPLAHTIDRRRRAADRLRHARRRAATLATSRLQTRSTRRGTPL